MKKKLNKPVKVSQQGSSVYISIPSTIKELLDIKKGDLLDVYFDGEEVTYKKIKGDK